MDIKKREQILHTFPELYEDTVRGLEINEGWYELVFKLSEKVVEYCIENEHEIPTVFVVKEKFGGLRFSLTKHDVDEELFDIINKFCEKSYKICEVCGNEGTLMERKGSKWVKTLCEKHSEEMGYESIGDNIA